MSRINHFNQMIKGDGTLNNMFERITDALSLKRVCALLLTLVMSGSVMVLPTAAQSNNAAVINSVTVGYAPDTSPNRITVDGTNFGTQAPTVRLRGVALALVSRTTTNIVAVLPAGITPGTYLLSVSPAQSNNPDNGENPKTVLFNVAIGAVGAQGLTGANGTPGTPGAQGPIGNTGAPGAQGPAGVPGAQGAQGEPGTPVDLSAVLARLAALEASLGGRAYVANSFNNSVSVIETLTSTVIETITVGDAPFGLTINPAGTRAYVANSDGGNISIIDTATNTVIGTIPVGSIPVSVTVNPAGTRLYVANFSGNSVSIIDAATNSVVTTVAVGNAPRNIAVNPAGTRVYVANFGGGDISIINTATNTVIGTVAVGRNPTGVAVK